MKILIFQNGYLSTGVSGGDKHIIDIAEEWMKEHEIAFMLPDYAAGRIIPGIRIISYPAKKPRNLAEIIIAYFIRFFRAMKIAGTEPADVVISSAGLFDVIPAIRHKCRYGSKVASYVYHLIPRRKAKNLVQALQFSISLLAQRMALYWFRKCDVVFVCNSFVKKGLEESGVLPSQVKISRLAVNVERVRRAEPDPKFQALFVGRIVVSKGVYDLIEAVRDLDITVGLAGGGDETDNVSALIRKYGMENRVVLLGSLPDNEQTLYSYLKGCDFLLFPSHEEGYGIAIAEAVAAGKPVITYELPHYKWAFGDGLITAPLGDVDALKANLKAYLEGKYDKEEILRKYQDVVIYDAARAAQSDLEDIMSASVVRQSS